MRNKDIAVSIELGSVDVQAIRTNHEAKKSVCTVAFKTDTTIKWENTFIEKSYVLYIYNNMTKFNSSHNSGIFRHSR